MAYTNWQQRIIDLESKSSTGNVAITYYSTVLSEDMPSGSELTLPSGLVFNKTSNNMLVNYNGMLLFYDSDYTVKDSNTIVTNADMKSGMTLGLIVFNGDINATDNVAEMQTILNQVQEKTNTSVQQNGDQTINGVKTFTSSPLVPTADVNGASTLSGIQTLGNTRASTGKEVANMEVVTSIATSIAQSVVQELLNYVTLADAQTISGVKTFSSSPVVPDLAQTDNSTKAANTKYVRAAVSALVNSSPETLDTLKELATALGNDPNFATTIANQIGAVKTTADAAKSNSDSHIANKSNPHGVTKAQVGLSSIPNAISDAVNSTSSTQLATSKAVKTAYDKGVEAKTAADGKLPLTGGTLSGPLTLNMGGTNYKQKHSSLDVSATDMTTMQNFGYACIDKNNKSVSVLATQYNTDHRCEQFMRVYKEGDNTKYADLGIKIYADGSSVANAPTPTTSAPNWAVMTKAATNRDYVKKTGDTILGNIGLKSIPNYALGETPSSNVYSVCDFYDKNNVVAGQVYFMAGSQGTAMHLQARNKKSDGTLVTHVLSSNIAHDGTKYAQCNHPRENQYQNDIDTLQASINRHPLKLTGNTKLYVGGANASDTADLFKGRGFSPEKPFATLPAAINYTTTNMCSGDYVVQIHLKDNISLPDSYSISCSNFPCLIIQGDDTQRQIQINKVARVGSGHIRFLNVNFVANGTISFFFDLSSFYNMACSLLLQGGISFNGTVINSTIRCDYGAKCFIGGSITGTVTGKRYECYHGGMIITQGRGANCIPGSEPGVCDTTSTYA